MYLFRFLISKYATGWGGAATQTFAPGGKYPRAATARALDCNFIARMLCKDIGLY